MLISGKAAWAVAQEITIVTDWYILKFTFRSDQTNKPSPSCDTVQRITLTAKNKPVLNSPRFRVIWKINYSTTNDSLGKVESIFSTIHSP